MKGTEKFAAIFYLAIYFYTKESNKIFDGCQGSKLSDLGLKKWKNLFQTFLFYHDWIMQKKFSRKDIKEKQMKVINLFQHFKEIVKRTDGSQLKIPKVHELLHSCRDILRHGPARGYDTCPTESNHRSLKNCSQNTQRIKSNFEKQTAYRIYENHIIQTAWKNSNNTCSAKTSYLSTSHTKKSSNNLHRQCTGKFHIVRKRISSNDSKRIHNDNYYYSFKNAKGQSLDNDIFFPDDLFNFIQQNIFYVLHESIEILDCYSIYKKMVLYIMVHHFLKQHTTTIQVGHNFNGMKVVNVQENVYCSLIYQMSNTR